MSRRKNKQKKKLKKVLIRNARKLLPCPKCGEMMVRRVRTKFDRSLLEKPFIYAKWDYCPKYEGGCGHVQHYDKYRIWNEEIKSFFKGKRRDGEYIKRDDVIGIIDARLGGLLATDEEKRAHSLIYNDIKELTGI